MSASVVNFGKEEHFRSRVAVAFEHAVLVIRHALPDARVDHVGSTAVPGSLTKGDLDICVAVPAEQFPSADAALARLFARNMGSDRTTSFSAFATILDGVDVGVQLVVCDSESDTFVAWRDLLVADNRIRAAYDDLKRGFEGRSMDTYRAAKSEFIRTWLRRDW